MQLPSLKTLAICKKVSNSEGNYYIGGKGEEILRKMEKERNMNVIYRRLG